MGTSTFRAASFMGTLIDCCNVTFFVSLAIESGEGFLRNKCKQIFLTVSGGGGTKLQHLFVTPILLQDESLFDPPAFGSEQSQQRCSA